MRNWCWKHLALKSCLTAHESLSLKSTFFSLHKLPGSSHVQIYWVYRQILFKTQKHFWPSLKLNYAVCVAGIRSSALSKPVTYSWNKFRFFKDIIFHISQRCLHIPVVLVLDILRTLNKLHSAGSETSFSGKHGSSAIRNNLLLEYWTVMKLWDFVLTLDAYFNTPLNIRKVWL